MTPRATQMNSAIQDGGLRKPGAPGMSSRPRNESPLIAPSKLRSFFTGETTPSKALPSLLSSADQRNSLKAAKQV